jgi:multicomponent Na+:H+ antiporter subunit D
MIATWVESMVPLPIAVSLLGAALATALSAWRTVQRVISLVTLTTVLVVAALLLRQVDRVGVVVHESGGWSGPLGIVFVADRLSAIMLTISGLMLLVVMLYAIGERGVERDNPAFHPLYLVLAAGVCASFLTGDLFNLFVAFEMMLAASYVLITLGGRATQVRSGMTYVVISLVASALFIAMLALLYAATGTVNMADLAIEVAKLPAGLRVTFAVVALGVFGIKAGLFPLFSWLPDSYPTAPGAVTAIFAGLLTKVGVYAILRTQVLVFDAPDWMGTVILVIAALTMAVGVLGAIAQDDVKRILSFHIVSQIGYIVFGIGLFTVAGIAGAVFYTVHHIIVKTTLFLVAELVERRGGTGRLRELGGLVTSAPLLALLFAVPALSLAGMPPFSGFLAKFALVDAGLEGRQWVVVAVSLAVSLFTVFSMTKIWSGVFWGEPGDTGTEQAVRTSRSPALMVVATGLLVLATLSFSVFAGPMYDLALRAADSLMDPSLYITSVLGTTS